ncbi:hypothetical protein TNCT_389871 [Trichonephila clavata]|uniref:Uncharacterized protein n=1 Tax=Trichonephila clavata TaxID=2740835 RepID=A0A8X6LCJ5_TRICU|nr:hypothetical protein TNCT_389871 [Trichonephila clavata]
MLGAQGTRDGTKRVGVGKRSRSGVTGKTTRRENRRIVQQKIVDPKVMTAYGCGGALKNVIIPPTLSNDMFSTNPAQWSEVPKPIISCLV